MVKAKAAIIAPWEGGAQVYALLATSAVREIDRPAVMTLFWLVHKIDGERSVFIQEAGSLIFARLHAGIAGLGGQSVEAHELDQVRARKVPKKMRGRLLSDSEAHALLDRIG